MHQTETHPHATPSCRMQLGLLSSSEEGQRDLKRIHADMGESAAVITGKKILMSNYAK